MRAMLSHTSHPTPNQVMASFLYPNFDILRYQFNHPTRNQPSEPRRTLLNRLQDAVRTIDSRSILTIARAAFFDVNGSLQASGIAQSINITSYENPSLTLIQSRQRQEPRSSEPALLPERLQEPHPSLEDRTTGLTIQAILSFLLTDRIGPSQPRYDDSLPHPPLGYPRR